MVSIAIADQTRRKFHRKNVQLSEFEKDRKTNKKVLINESKKLIQVLNASDDSEEFQDSGPADQVKGKRFLVLQIILCTFLLIQENGNFLPGHNIIFAPQKKKQTDIRKFKPQAPVQPSKGKGTAHRPLAKESILNKLDKEEELDIFGNVISKISNTPVSNAPTSVSSHKPLPQSNVTYPSSGSQQNYLPRKPSVQDFSK